MPYIPLETAIVAALIGFAASLIGQFVAVFLGARYAANLNRNTQRALADLSFERQWRERRVNPFLELANQRLLLISEFNNAVAESNFERAMKLAQGFNRTEAMVHAAMFATIGDTALTAAGDAWMKREHRLALIFEGIAEKQAIFTEDIEAIARELIDLADTTGRLYFHARRYAASIE